jgi:acyl carrier protein
MLFWYKKAMALEMTKNELFEQIRQLFAEIFGVDAQSIDHETQFGDFPQWDSMGHMDLMVSLESRFGIEISAETISTLTSVPAILEHIHGKQDG